MRYKNVLEFGDAKLRVFDIDPLYTAAYRSKLSLKVRQRFTFAEVAFDLAGVAADIADAPDFWTAMQKAAESTKRGAPRRYFRGRVAFEAIAKMQKTFGAGENVVAALKGTYAQVRVHIKETMPQFGDCAAFKIADMAERVCGNKIDFSAVDIYKVCNSEQVLKGAIKAAQILGCTQEALLPRLLKYKWATKASPDFNRKIEAQEIETILCYYSHDDEHNKHFPGMDALGIKKELDGHGKLAQKLLRNLPTEGGML